MISSNEKQSEPCGERTHPSGASTAPKALSVAHSMSHNALASMTSNLRPPKYTRAPLSDKTIAHWRSVLAERREHEAMLATIGSGANQPFFECELGEVDVEMGVQAWIASPQHHEFHCVIEMGSDQQRYSQIPRKKIDPCEVKVGIINMYAPNLHAPAPSTADTTEELMVYAPNLHCHSLEISLRPSNKKPTQKKKPSVILCIVGLLFISIYWALGIKNIPQGTKESDVRDLFQPPATQTKNKIVRANVSARGQPTPPRRVAVDKDGETPATPSSVKEEQPAKQTTDQGKRGGGGGGGVIPERDPDCTSVIKNIPQGTKESDVRDLFQPPATQTKNKIVRANVSARGQPTPPRRVAVDKDGETPATPSSVKEEQPAKQTTDQGKRGGGGGGGGVPERDPDCTSVIKNIPQGTKESDVRDLFQPPATQTKNKIVRANVSARGQPTPPRRVAVDKDGETPATPSSVKEEQPAKQTTDQGKRGGGGGGGGGVPERDPDCTSVIKNIPQGTKESDVRDLFQPPATQTKNKIVRANVSARGQPTPPRRVAVDKDGETPATPSSVKEEQPAKQTTDQGKRGGGGGGGGVPERDPDCTSVIKNIPQGTKESDVRDLFQPPATQTKNKIVRANVSARGQPTPPRRVAVDKDGETPATPSSVKEEQPAKQTTDQGKRGGGGGGGASQKEIQTVPPSSRTFRKAPKRVMSAISFSHLLLKQRTRL